MSLLNLWNNLLSDQVRGLIKKVIGLIENDQDDQETLKQMKFLEKLSFKLSITRRGHQQDKIDYVEPYFHLNNYLIRIITIIQIIRVCLLIKYSDNEDIQVYLASGVYHLPDGNVLLTTVNFWTIILFILREYILYMEDTGKFMVLTVLRDISSKGFDKSLLRLTDRQCKLFRSLFHFLINFWNLSIIGIYLLDPFVLTYIRIQNPEFRNGSSTLFISTFFGLSLNGTHLFSLLLEFCLFRFML